MVRLAFLIVALFAFIAPSSAQTLTGESVPPPAGEFLLDLVREAGLSEVRVTSFERTPQRQAELMYELLETAGVVPVRDQYESIGDSVVDFYEANRERMDRPELIRGMEEVVFEGVSAMPDREQMMHVLPTNNYTFDVAPSSVADEDAFAAAIIRHSGYDLAEFILPGPAERAFHLEVPKTLPTIAGRYAGVCAEPPGRAVLPVAVTIVRGPEGYSGRYTVYGEVLPLTMVEVDRVTKEAVLHADVDGQVFVMTGAMLPDYSALILRAPESADLTCRLGREDP